MIIGHSKYLTKNILESTCDNEVLNFKLHLMDHLATDINVFGNLNDLDNFPYEHSHIFLKGQFRESSRRRSTAVEENVKIMGSNKLRARDRSETSLHLEHPTIPTGVLQGGGRNLYGMCPILLTLWIFPF